MYKKHKNSLICPDILLICVILNVICEDHVLVSPLHNLLLQKGTFHCYAISTFNDIQNPVDLIQIWDNFTECRALSKMNKAFS